MKEAERRAAMHGNDAHSIFATAKDIMVEDPEKVICEKRRQEAVMARKREKEIDNILKEWDRDASGGLSWGELEAFLKDLAAKNGHPDYIASEEDIKWMIAKATKNARALGTSKHLERAPSSCWSEWRSGDHQLDHNDLAA